MRPCFILGGYVALGSKTNKMIRLDKVNPKVYRYLGYAAYKMEMSMCNYHIFESFINAPGESYC
jgi:hypothetical protein